MGKTELTKTEKKYNKKDVFALKEIFDDADVDRSGEIDAAELRKALNRSNLGDAADDFFKAIDKDGSKKIGFDEYLRVRAAERGVPVTPASRLTPRRVVCSRARRDAPATFFSFPRFREKLTTNVPPRFPSLQAYYRKASPQEIRDMMLWVYPPKVEKPPEPKRLSEAQKAEIKSIFVLYDLNDNGLLDKKELLEALADTGYDDDEIEEMFEEYDTNGDGDIDLQEFERMLEQAYLS